MKIEEGIEVLNAALVLLQSGVNWKDDFGAEGWICSQSVALWRMVRASFPPAGHKSSWRKLVHPDGSGEMKDDRARVAITEVRDRLIRIHQLNQDTKALAACRAETVEQAAEAALFLYEVGR